MYVSSISFDSHLRWCKLIDISPLLLWDVPLYILRYTTHKDFFNNEYIPSLLELSISCLHRCVNILTIESLKESMNLFV